MNSSARKERATVAVGDPYISKNVEPTMKALGLMGLAEFIDSRKLSDRRPSRAARPRVACLFSRSTLGRSVARIIFSQRRP